MNIIFFSNPDFFGSEKRSKFSSMPRFTNMLVDGMKDKGHEISVWAPGSRLFDLPVSSTMKKWLGYVDQYIIFPFQVRKLLKSCDQNTLFVFTDQAQGPWIPLVHNRKHVMHCHDFIAQWSAQGKIEGQKLGLAGKIYQQYIRNGYRKGKNFITSSNKTTDDFKLLMPKSTSNTYMVYLGMDDGYKPQNQVIVREMISKQVPAKLDDGYLLHVGENHWYKNKEGVIEIYDAWRSKYKTPLPLLLIGPKPNKEIQDLYDRSPYKNDIHFLIGYDDEMVRAIYAGASLFIFPSYAEGFGWPNAEAMASGCPVVTTNAAPMTEVVGSAGFLIPIKNVKNITEWAATAAEVVQNVLSMPEEKKKVVIDRSIENANRFNRVKALNSFENIYKKIFDAPLV